MTGAIFLPYHNSNSMNANANPNTNPLPDPSPDLTNTNLNPDRNSNNANRKHTLRMESNLEQIQLLIPGNGKYHLRYS